MAQTELIGPSGEFLDYLDREIFPNLDRAEVFSDLDPQNNGANWSLDCPNCGKREARVRKNGFILLCPRPKGCGHVTSLIAHASEVPFPRGKGFITAVRILSEMAGRDFFRSEISQEDLVWAGEKDRRVCLLEAFMDFARSKFCTEVGAASRDRFEKEFGLSEGSSQLLDPGFYPSVEEVKETLHEAGCYLLTGEDLGFFSQKWEGLIVFPWMDLLGRMVNVFGIRMGTIPEREKEYESLNWVNQERPILDTVIPFDGEDVLFGLYQASQLKRKNLLLVSDPLQALVLQILGIDDPFPIAGLDGIREKQVNTLNGYLESQGELILHLTNSSGIDESTLEKTRKGFSLLEKEGNSIRVIDTKIGGTNPREWVNQTPGKFVLDRGPSAYRSLLGSARS